MIKIQIVKRNGDIQEFNSKKISIAIEKAFKESKEPYTEKDIQLITDLVVGDLKEKSTVEQIQDYVFNYLCKLGFIETAKSFERYRTRRAILRDKRNEKAFKNIELYLSVGDDENSNKKTEVANVKRDLVAGEYFRLRKESIMDKELLSAHNKKAIYIHDFDQWEQLTNCNITNLSDMLINGTFITNAYINQPNSIQTAFNIASQISLSIANQEYGGISYTNINELMAFFAKKNFRKNFIEIYRLISNIQNSSLDKIIEDLETQYGKIDSGNNKLELNFERVFKETKEKTRKDIYDACQIFEYQVNSLSASSQTPFITITFNIPTSWESEEIILQYLKVRRRGLGKKEGEITTIFPKLSYFLVDGYNLKEGDKYFYITKEVAKTQVKCVYPDILNVSKEDYDKGKYYARMGKHIQPNNN